VCQILSQNVVDIFFLSETKIDDSFPNSQFHVSYFSMYRKDRDANGGGLVAYINSLLPHCCRQDFDDLVINNIEGMVFEIHIKKRKWLICLMYKPPSVRDSLFIQCFTNIIEQMLLESTFIMAVGDLNCDMNFDNPLTNCCKVLGLYNLIKTPTCFKGTPSILDVILTSSPSSFTNDFINNDACLSDFHNLIGCSFKAFAPTNINHKVCYRSFKKFDEKKYLDELSNVPFNDCYISPDGNEQINTFMNLFEGTVNKHAPLKFKTIKKIAPPFMNGNLRKAIFKKCMLRNRFFKCRTDTNWNLYRDQRNKVTKLRRDSIRNYFQIKVQGINNSKDFWKIIRPFISDKSKIGYENVILREGDSLITDCLEVCNTFNKFFTSITDDIGFPDNIPSNISGTALIDVICEKYASHSSVLAIKRNVQNKQFYFSRTDEPEVKKIILQLNSKKAAGYDFITPKILKDSIHIICPVITRIINHCIEQGIFPDQLKLAEVSSIFKKKDKLDKGNYRPISVLIVSSKVFEKIYVKRITFYFQSIFSSLLSGYREHYSCEDVLLKFITSWKLSLDKNHYFGAVLMDLSKAFDCLPHGLLIAKLRAYGFTDHACLLLCSYLQNRHQRVKIGSTKSDWLLLNKGVPQGSILGPILFNIFINDMFYFIKSAILLNYADDNTIISDHFELDKLIECLTTESNIAINWFDNNGMQANPSKFQIIMSHRYHNSFKPINIGNISVMPQENVKLLGIIFDRKLTFNSHVDAICKKASRALNVLKRFSKTLNTENKLKIYQSFITSNFTYCPTIWHFCGKTQTRNMEKIHERSLRFVFNDFNSSYMDLLQKANRDTLHVMRLKRITVLVYKCFHKMGPAYLHSMFTPKTSIYTLRNPILFEQPRVSTVFHGLNSVFYHGPKIWNNLPNSIKSVATLSKFKLSLKKYKTQLCNCSYCESFCSM
jgi:hypothetical protein